MPGSKEEDFERNNAFSLYDLYGHTLAQGHEKGHEIYNFGRPFLVIITIHLYCTIPLSREEDFLRNTSILHFSPEP